MHSSKSKSRWYIRSGSSTIEAKGEVLDELREMANRVPFDERGNEQIAIDDLSPVLVLDYLRRVKSRLTADFTGRTLEQVLEQLDLYEGPQEQRRLKNVAAMMFSEEPHRFFPYTRVEIVLFPEGTVRNPNNFMEAPTITGSVPTMIRATLDYLRLMVIKERIRKVPYAAEAIRHFNYPYQSHRRGRGQCALSPRLPTTRTGGDHRGAACHQHTQLRWPRSQHHEGGHQAGAPAPCTSLSQPSLGRLSQGAGFL